MYEKRTYILVKSAQKAGPVLGHVLPIQDVEEAGVQAYSKLNWRSEALMLTLQYLLFDFGRDSYASEESNQEKLMDGNAFHKP